jgi:hypothetical protein
MKLFVAGLFVASMVVMSGCTAATPAYTPAERFAQIHRNTAFELEANNDDIDNLLMLRPSSQLSIWNVYHRP